MFKKQTFCPRLWNEFFINKDGGVFSCCHKKPSVVGNIYQERLSDICNNRIMQNLRQKSLIGKLNCYNSCILLRKDKNTPAKKNIKIDYGALKRLKISFGDMCNINCVMCHRNIKDIAPLDFEKVKEQVDLSPFGSIEIQGGEPLFIDAAKKFFDHVSSLDKKVSFLTNGLLINDEWAKKIALHSSFINFSLNAATKKTHEFINRGSRWELVLENIQRVRNFRNALNTPLNIIGHMTIIPKNLEEIPLFIRTFRELGFDSINFGYDVQVPFYLRLYPFKTRDLSLGIKKAIGSLETNPQIDSYRLKLLGLI